MDIRNSIDRSGWLTALSLVTFAVGTDDFVIAGALPQIAADLDVSAGAAGQLVTVFSVAYALSAPLMAALTRAWSPRRLLLIGLLVFGALNLLTTAAPGYLSLLVLRAVTAVVAGALTPAAFALAGSRAPRSRQGRAIGTVAAGLTASLAVGVPIGTWLSQNVGWRSTFVAVALFTTVAAVAAWLTLPATEPVAGSRPGTGVLDGPRRSPILASAAATTIGACAGLMPYTYVAPITTSLTGGGGELTLVIATVGLAGAGGAVLGGRLTDAVGPDAAMIGTFGTALLAVGVLGALASVPTVVPTPLVAALLALWGVAAWANNAPMNARTLRLAGPHGTAALALNTSGLYVGIAAGSTTGGLAVDRWGAAGVLASALVIGGCGLLVMVGAARHWPTDRPS